MKGVIYFHSNTGNTRLMCQYAAQKLPSVAFDFIDIAENSTADVKTYGVIGFATWTYYLGLPPLLSAFIDALPEMPGKPVFLLSSFGMMPGWSLRLMERALTRKGCTILGGYALHMPENYPPLIIKGMDSPQAPEPKERQAFDAFLTGLNRQLGALKDGHAPSKTPIPFDWLNYLIRPYSVQKARKEMGHLTVDPQLCGGCQTCQKVCLYQAIRFDTQPVFEESRCHACYACFNHCPRQAIYTTKIRGKGQYSGPSGALKEKLTVA